MVDHIWLTWIPVKVDMDICPVDPNSERVWRYFGFKDEKWEKFIKACGGGGGN